MHIVNNGNANIIMAWCAVITLFVGVLALWSKRQDRAIKKVEDALSAEKKSGLRLRGYIWQLLHILDTRKISYPAPPDELYDTAPKED